jgi:hypothetical protein
MQIISPHGVRFGGKGPYYKAETKIDRDDKFGSTRELNSQRAGTPVPLLRRII